MTYSPNLCKAQPPDKYPMRCCLPSHSSNGTRWTWRPWASSRESWTRRCGPTTLMSEMLRRSGPIWKPSTKKQEELIPTSNSLEWSNRHSPTLQTFCPKYRSSKKIINAYFPMVTLDLVVFMFCSTLPNSYQDTTGPRIIGVTAVRRPDHICPDTSPA